jgi:cell division protein FtsB
VRIRRRVYEEPPALQRLYALDGGLVTTPTAEERPAKEHPHRRRRILFAIWTAAVVVVAGLVLLLVLPTRAWLSQRHDIAAAEERLAEINAENDRLGKQVAALQTPEAIENVARGDYTMVEPGQQVFSVLPAPSLTNLPSGWPFNLLREIVAARAASPHR